MTNKAVLGALSAVLVAAVIGAASDDSLVASSKSVTDICASTDYADVCERTLNAAINGSASPKEIIQASFMAAIREIEAASHLSNNVSLKATDSMNKDGFDICRRLFEDATEELQAAFSETHDLDGLARRTDDIKCWLSAVISYQQTCLDGITQTDLHSTMKDGLVTASQVTSNAIAIVDGLSSLFKNFQVPINVTNIASRRLLSQGSDAKGYPTWFSAHDRKLLAVNARPLVIQNCCIVLDKRLFPDRLKIPSYLGRPWKAYSRTIIMDSTIGDLIKPEGWLPWDGDQFLKTLFYAEYGNRGPGAVTSGRVNWPGFHVINRQTAQAYTMRMKGIEAKGQVVVGITSRGEVIKLEDMVLWGGIAIVLDGVAIVSIADALDELIEGDVLSIVLIDVSSGLWWPSRLSWSISSISTIEKDRWSN
uniref:Pectinesterase inhibitor domain-containing protein n=1 Tax=Musa acuminata subsp. malaccensis TaxID=214687 RepID=A0A804JPR8_MUSAM